MFGKVSIFCFNFAELPDPLDGLPLSCGMEALLRIQRRGCRGSRSRSRSARSARSAPATGAFNLLPCQLGNLCASKKHKAICVEQKRFEENPNCKQALKTCAGCFSAERWPIHHPLHGTFLTCIPSSEFQISDCDQFVC